MRKTIYRFLYITSLTLAVLSIHQAFAQQRGPAVEQLAEVEIGSAHSNGFDFSKQKRIPAADIRKNENSVQYSYIGPILFFILALPFTLWVLIARKVKAGPDDKKHKYYAHTSQFTPFKTDYQKQEGEEEEEEDDEIDYHKSA